MPSYSLLSVTTTTKHGSKHYTILNMCLVSRLFHQVSGATQTNGIALSVPVKQAPPTMIRPNTCFIDGSSDFPRPSTTVLSVEFRSIPTMRITVRRPCIKSGESSHTFDRICNTVLLPVMANAEMLHGTPLLFSSAIHLLNSFNHSEYGATSAQQLRLHINPEVRTCTDWCVYLFDSGHCPH